MGERGVLPGVSERFGEIAREVGYEDADVVAMCKRFHREGRGAEFIESVLLGKVGEKVDNKMAEALMHMIFGEGIVGGDTQADKKQLFRLGRALHEFGRTMYKDAEMPEGELKDMSLLSGLMKEFFLQGRFVDLAQTDHLLTATAGFMVNQLAKIKQTRPEDRQGYSGPGTKIKAFSLEDEEVRDLFQRVDRFGLEYLSSRGLGKELPAGPNSRKKNDVLRAQVRTASDASRREMMRLETNVWKGREAEGLYHTKNALMVADFLSRDNHTLADLIPAVGKESIIARANHNQAGEPYTRGNTMFYYDFEEGQFGIHKKGEPIPSSKGGGSKGDRVLHYEPDALMFIGLVVEYFKHQKGVAKK